MQLLSSSGHVPPLSLTSTGSTSAPPPLPTTTVPVSVPPTLAIQHQSQSQSAMQPSVSSLLYLPTSQPSFSSILRTSVATLPVSEPSRPPSKKQKKNSVPISKEAIENELLKRELDAVSARVTSLERELTTFKEKCLILTERIKFFEDQHTKNLHDQYFPPEPEQTPRVTRPAVQPPPCSTPDATPSASPQWLPPHHSSLPAHPTSQPTQVPNSLLNNPETEAEVEPTQSHSVPPTTTCSPPSSPPGLSAPQLSDHCQCMQEINLLKHQMSLITQEIATLTTPSRADVGVRARRSENDRNRRTRRSWSHSRGHPPTKYTSVYQRTPVWLPGLMPPPQPHHNNWKTQSRWSWTSLAGRRATPHPTSVNLIYLN